MNNISNITYTSDSGTILPELQWHEQISITRNKVSLTRNGRVAQTMVNAGAWEYAVDAEAVQLLFAQLQAIDRSTIKRIEPDDPPDGGNTASYSIGYVSGERLALVFDPGVTYTNGILIVQPIDAFIKSLKLPAEATSRYT